MKKAISLITGAAMLLSCNAPLAFAEGDPVPVDVDEAVYAQLMENQWACDGNYDGVITEEELAEAIQLDIDLDGIEDLSWVSKLSSCIYLQLKGGTLTDLSALKEMPSLKKLECSGVPVTDISFIKDMELEECHLEDMEQITIKQRVSVLSYEDYTIEQGYSDIIAVQPVGLLDGYSPELKLDDTEAAEFLNERYDRYGEKRGIYGKLPGNTAYRMYADGEEILSGTITVTPLERTEPELNSFTSYPEVYDSFYYGTHYMILEGSSLYAIKGDTLYKAEEDIKGVSRTYKKDSSGKYVYIDLALKQDGTLLLNGQAVDGLTFDYVQNGCAVTADGTLYEIYPSRDKIVTVKVGEDCAKIIDTSNSFYLSETGEMIWYYIGYDSAGAPTVRTQKTGIYDPTPVYYNMYIDGDSALWKCDSYKSFSKKKIADDVVKAGYYLTSKGYMDNVYQTSDGKWYQVSGGSEVEVYETDDLPTAPSANDSGCFYIHAYDAKYGDGTDLLINWFITSDDTLTIDLAGQHFAISDVAQVIGAEYVEEQDKGYAWFIRKDGSVWRYCFEAQKAEQVSEFEPGDKPERVLGDANGDGEFSVSDVILLQKWLLAVPDNEIADWKAVDICEDGVIDVFDLVSMKKALLAKSYPAPVSE